MLGDRIQVTPRGDSLVPTAAYKGEPLDINQLLRVLAQVKNGDFSARLPVDWTGLPGKVADTLNSIIELNRRTARELERISRLVGKEGKITQRVSLGQADGDWARQVESVNSLVEHLVHPPSEMARVIEAVANGDLSQTMELELEGRPLQGQFLRTARTVNTMVRQLNAFASEVTRVAREVGTEGKLGGQAKVQGVAGVWKDLTDSVNSMARNLTGQVRNIAEVTTAVAKGDLSKKITVDVRGELLELKNTINVMVDQLNAFASEVTRVAREVGTEGKLGGQASVPGASGTWRDLTENVNQLAANLTTQVRAIADVTTAVTEGDLTQSIRVEAQGEVAVLKDKINEMIRKLHETTTKNQEQDWLKTNLTRFTRMLQGQRDLTTVSELILSELVPLASAQQGLFYTMDSTSPGGPRLKLRASYAHPGGSSLPQECRLGEGLVGQCALDKKRIVLTNLPSDYLKIGSGPGAVPPATVIIQPVLFEGKLKGILELASLQPFSPSHEAFLDQLTESIGIVLNTIEANMRTEELLQQSQLLFAEAQEASRSKSAFLSMAAHELRTPLSVILGYVSMLEDGSLGQPPGQWRKPLDMLMLKAKELNRLVDDLLMAARVEGGTVPTKVLTLELRRAAQEAIARAEARAALLNATVSCQLPPSPVMVEADPDQVGRILDNLINNALTYSIDMPTVRITVSDSAQPQVAVEDNGVGIPRELHDQVFERFFRIDDPRVGPQPGTGLGLYIGRGLAERHGGTLVLDHSEPGLGSTFVLRLRPAGRTGSRDGATPTTPVELTSETASVVRSRQ